MCCHFCTYENVLKSTQNSPLQNGINSGSHCGFILTAVFRDKAKGKKECFSEFLSTLASVLGNEWQLLFLSCLVLFVLL